MATLDKKQTEAFVFSKWDDEITPKLQEYIKIPNQSPAYDPEWATNGYQEQVVDMMVEWVKQQDVRGLEMRVEKLEGRTPLIFMTIEGEAKTDETILLYGHFDKQPPMTEFWAEGLGPHKPVIRDGKLYGRGGADDGYAIFASIMSIKACQLQGVPHARCVVMIEGCEESGSFDLPYYVEHLKADIKTPSLVICLDSGCGNYEQMWMTTSLRGLCAGDLKIKIINEAVHSGSASGIVPSTFRIMRMLLNRVEDTETGEVLVKECYAEIPAEHVENAKATADALGDVVFEEFPFVEGAQPMGDKKKTEDMILARTWKPMISYTGIEGLPNLTDAGNVLRTDTNVKLSMRIPPTVDPKVAGAAVKAVLEANPPYGAHVEFELEDGAAGWKAPEMEPWVMASADEASKIYFGKPAVGYGEGGTIPLMGMLSAVFPGCQFVITGLLGPGSNAHGPNEFLHLDMGKKLTCCMANMLADHHTAKVVNANK